MRVWSESQKEVIYANDDRILVSASAGSGKTTVMIERILRLIGDGVKLSNMLVCTFTKASAADMRAKLYAEMSKRGFKNELKELSRADISTIDSFCQRLVCKYFYVLGIDPQFEVLDDGESMALKGEAVDKAIAESQTIDDDFARLCEILRTKRRNGKIKEALTAIMDFRSINPDSSPSYVYDQSETEDKIKSYLAFYKKKVRMAIERLFEVVDESELYAELLTALESGVGTYKRRKLKNPDIKPCVDYLKALVKDYRETVDEAEKLLPQSLSRNYINALLNAAHRAYEEYNAEKTRRSAVDFSDLENMALEILRSDMGAEIRKKYTYVFVDEYQDINPLQETILSKVADGNKLFMVGDLKQSIYAFRGCAPQIFKHKYDVYGGGEGGKLIKLDTNYRSAKKIISFVNEVFGNIMTDEFGGVEYRLNPMSAFKEEDGYVKLHVITGKEISPDVSGVYSVRAENDVSLSKKEAEANLIAFRIKELLSNQSELVSLSDIAILTRSMGTLEDLVIAKLRKMNIPVSLKENAYYRAHPVSGQLISFLRLIDNRRDDKAMALSMLSALGGFGENELADIRLNGEGSFYECVLNSHSEKVKDFIKKLDRYYELSLIKNVDELADIIVSECGYFNYAFKLGNDAAEVLDKFLEFLGGCPYKSVLSSTLKYIDEHDPYAELMGNENSVKLMTIHKSKGLEFKYVFLIGLGESFNLKDLSKSIYVDSEICMDVYDDHAAFCSDLKFIKRTVERKKLLEEELRIFYVALTRAQFGLELFGSVGESNSSIAAYRTEPAKIVDLSECTSPICWLAPMLIYAREYDMSEISVEESEPRKVFIGGADEKLVEKLTDYFDFSLPKNAPIKSYVSKLAHDSDEPAIIIIDEPTEGNSIERGNAYHRAMEKIDFLSPDLSAIDGEDMALIDKDKLLAAAGKMNRFKGKVYKEKPFMLRLDASEIGEGRRGSMLVQGVIDLLIIDGDSATIVDYKTGAAHGRFESGYIRQVNLYALATQRLLGIKEVKKYLYYFDSGIFVEIE